MPPKTLEPESRDLAKRFFDDVVSMGIDFKTEAKVNEAPFIVEKHAARIVTALNDEGQSLGEVLENFRANILPFCTNFGSENFMGFPDAGNSIAAVGWAILKDFLQQNLINQSFCSPSATFVEIAVIRWLREYIGYQNTPDEAIDNIFEVGGIVTSWWTGSNAIGMMLARENKYPWTMEAWMHNPENCCVLVPKWLWHYSVKSWAMWTWCGNNLIEVETNDFRYDLNDLHRKLQEFHGRIMAVVTYAGDSRTMTVDNLEGVYDTVKSQDERIWMHADACHGFSLAFSKALKHKIWGLKLYDSVTLDPHKVMLTPYTISALLVKKPEDIKKVVSLSDLIMQEDYAFGQITPFIGSKSWESLKLWFMMKHYGKDGLDSLILARHNLAKYLEDKLIADPDFIMINKVDINSAVFMYAGSTDLSDIPELNRINREIHKIMLEEWRCHLHQFSIPDNGALKKGEIIYPLRFMSGNPNTTPQHIDAMVEYVREIWSRCTQGHNPILCTA